MHFFFLGLCPHFVALFLLLFLGAGESQRRRFVSEPLRSGAKRDFPVLLRSNALPAAPADSFQGWFDLPDVMLISHAKGRPKQGHEQAWGKLRELQMS